MKNMLLLSGITSALVYTMENLESPVELTRNMKLSKGKPSSNRRHKAGRDYHNPMGTKPFKSHMIKGNAQVINHRP